MISKTPVNGLLLASLVLGLAACGNDDDPPPPAPAPPPVTVADTVATTASGKVVSFARAAPGTIAGTQTMTGMVAGETVLGIDRRPADGLLYALGSAGRLYVLDPATGVLTLKSVLATAPGESVAFAGLPAGERYGVDFNPMADRLRVVASGGLDLRINVDTGAVIVDGAINGGPGGTAITGSAYTNAFAGTRATTLYGIDAARGTLFTQNPPNAGTLSVPVPLGVAATALNGFDIDARTNDGFAALEVGGTNTLYRIALAPAAGAVAATAVGRIAIDEPLTGLALMQPAAPTAHGLTADGRLIAFAPGAPGTITATTPITGLGAGERVLGIDFRPAGGALYALTSAARVVTVDPATGAATSPVTLSAAASDTTAPYTGLLGTAFTVDFNPAADRLRVISDQGQSLRIDVSTGATITDGTVNRAVPASVVGGAYAGSFAGATTTTLYDLDAAGDVLAIQNPPNDGTLVDVGPLGVDLAAQTGFDIAGGANGLALAAVGGSPGTPSTLYVVSLATGAMTLATPGDAAASRIGGAGGPGIIDLAIRY